MIPHCSAIESNTLSIYVGQWTSNPIVLKSHDATSYYTWTTMCFSSIVLRSQDLSQCMGRFGI